MPKPLNHLWLNSSIVRALSDGSYFLAHGRELLPRVALEPYCLQCRSLGLDATVRLTPDSILANWQCGHTAGWADKKRRIELPELLYALGWGLRCSACKEDAVGENAPEDSTLGVRCGCTSRIMVNPAPQVSVEAQVAQLGRR